MMKTIPKPTHGSEDWLVARWRDEHDRVVFGASDAPALMNASPYKSRGDLFVDKVQRPVVQESNPVFHRGNVLEPALVAEAGRVLGISVVTPDLMYCRDRFRISLDGVDDEMDPAVVIEAKTTTRYRVSNADDLPPEWLWQAWAQTLVTGAPVFFVVLDRDQRLSVIETPDKPEAIDALLEESEIFGALVDSGEMPPTLDDFSADQIATLTKAEPSRIELPSDALSLVEQLVLARGLRKSAEQEEEHAKDALARLLGGNEIGSIGGMDVVSWKQQGGKSRLDTRSLIAAHPELRDQFTVNGAPFRVMRVLINTMKEGE
jgi:predicted phage-related endonuclease